MDSVAIVFQGILEEISQQLFIKIKMLETKNLKQFLLKFFVSPFLFNVTFLYPLKTKKSEVFFMVSGGIKMKHWVSKDIGWANKDIRYLFMFPLMLSILETWSVIFNIENRVIFHNNNTNVILSLYVCYTLTVFRV